MPVTTSSTGSARPVTCVDRDRRHASVDVLALHEERRPARCSGRPGLQQAGQNFGYIRNDKVYGLDGRYRGTIVGDRLIYRSTESAATSGARAGSAGIGGSARASRAGSAIWGDEPNTEP